MQQPNRGMNFTGSSRALLRWRSGLLFSILICLLSVNCAGGPSATNFDGVVVLQSDGSPAFAEVTRKISEKSNGSVTVFSLKGNADADAEIVQDIQRRRPRLVVAVGLSAALAVRKVQGTKAIFCQVFNYEDFDLLTPWMKGVGAVPSLTQQFQIWKKLDPKLTRVGVITGPRLVNLLTEARAAASANGVDLKHVQVGSSLETLYAFKQLESRIQGLWLLPDNRVLSRNTIRDLLSYSRKEGKQVVGFGEQLLQLGAMMSVQSDYNDIADQVIARGRHALETNGPEVPGPSMLPLSRISVKINPIAVRQLGLKFPAELKDFAYVP